MSKEAVIRPGRRAYGPWLKPRLYAGVTLAGALTVMAAAPPAAAAQPPTPKKLSLIGWLSANSSATAVLVEVLREIGYVRERDYHLESRATEGVAQSC